jgi:UDP-3-O-[3-hydroxymyristoyl] glucosamine N-acyltransferase
MNNPFFKNKSSFKIDKLLKLAGVKNNNKFNNLKVYDIKDLSIATDKDITFFHSIKYSDIASKTKASFCIASENLKNYLPTNCQKIIVDNVLISAAKITKILYPDSVTDDFDISVKEINKTSFKKIVKFGKNVLIGKKVKIGKNCSIGHNTIIEKNVIIGNNCSIGSNVIIRNTIVNNNVHILDGCVIGKNTYLDNQIHIAHNVKIGDNCIIAGQVGFAGSSTLGNHVMIGGQAGISGHLKIGNNVKIGGGSGVLKDIPDNSKVIGYPAKDLKNFIKENK